MGSDCSRLGASDPPDRRLHRASTPELTHLNEGAGRTSGPAGAILLGRGLLAIAIDDRERAESAYQALLPYAARPTGADTGLMTLWPAAQILADLARHLGFPGTDTHYKRALATAERRESSRGTAPP
jgi:hypothetical protein